jgi:hypothetical protein
MSTSCHHQSHDATPSEMRQKVAAEMRKTCAPVRCTLTCGPCNKTPAPRETIKGHALLLCAGAGTYGVDMLTRSVVTRMDEAPARSAYSVSECTSTRPPRPGVSVISDAYADWISKSVLEETSLPSIVPGTTVCKRHAGATSQALRSGAAASTVGLTGIASMRGLTMARRPRLK